MKSKCFWKFSENFIDKNKLSEYIKTENYEVFIAKIAREVHDLKHRKLQKRNVRGQKLRGHGVLWNRSNSISMK